MYPIKFQNLFFDKVWGGGDFYGYKETLPNLSVGESWEVSCHENGMSIVDNGEHKGKTLGQLINELGHKLIGTKISKNNFPLLIKIISAKDKLSVQVHPDNDYASKFENSLGKTEAWYILDCEKNAELIIGTKDCLKEDFKLAIEENNLEPYLNKVKVKKGDMYFIKSGLVHAILGNTLILEIQQNSDITYRVYDYGRDRELHVDRALEVIDFNLISNKLTGLTVFNENYTKTYLCICEYFVIERYEITDIYEENSDEERFYTLFVLDGIGQIEYNEGTLEIGKGDSIFIPASLGKYKVKGKINFIKSYVPNFLKTINEILENCVCN